MTRVIDKDELPRSKVAHKVEGHRYGEVDVSFLPAGVPHKFVNSGSGSLRQVDIHPSGRVRQVNILEDVSGE